MSLLLLSIIGMDITWLTHWTALLTGTGSDPSHRVPALALLGLLLSAHWIARLLIASDMPLGLQQFILGLLAVTAALVLIGACLYNQYPFLQFDWLAIWLEDLTRLEGYGGPGLILVGVALYGCWRGMSLAQSRLMANSVQFYLRWGILAWLFFYLITPLLAPASVSPGWVLLFFFLGLLAVGLARVEEVRQERGAIRSPFTTHWLLILAGCTLGVIGIGLLGSLIVSPALVAAFWWGLLPLWRALDPLFYGFLQLIALVLTPLMEWLMSILAPAMNRSLPLEGEIGPIVTPTPGTETVGPPVFIRVIAWAIAAMVFVGIVTLVVTGLRKRQATAGERKLVRETVWETAGSGGGSGLGARLRHLRDRLRGALSSVLPPHYSLGNVREIYANLLHLTAWKGLPREEAETPYEFKSRLDSAWPDIEQDAKAITEAYVRARYGERPFNDQELVALRAIWLRLRRSIEEPGANKEAE